jgi:hypothetical protein
VLTKFSTWVFKTEQAGLAESLQCGVGFVPTAHELGGDAERPRLSLSNSSTVQGGGKRRGGFFGVLPVTAVAMKTVYVPRRDPPRPRVSLVSSQKLLGDIGRNPPRLISANDVTQGATRSQHAGEARN